MKISSEIDLSLLRSNEINIRGNSNVDIILADVKALGKLSQVKGDSDKWRALVSADVDSALKLAAQFVPQGKIVAENYGEVITEEHNRPLTVEHEHYFDIVRVDINNLELVMDNLLHSFSLVMADAQNQPCTMPKQDFEVFLTCLQGFASIAADMDTDIQPVEIRFDYQPNNEHLEDPVYRWKVGHYLFFSIIQMLIVSLSWLKQAIEQKDEALVKKTLVCTSNLYRSSIVGFIYGTNYHSDNYQNEIRESMGPPEYSPGFSDINSVDHRYMLKLLSDVRKLGLDDYQHLDEFHNYLEAIASLYDQHSLVCKEAVGATSSLLQMTGTEEQQTDPAYLEIQNKYKVRTMKLSTTCPFQSKKQIA